MFEVRPYEDFVWGGVLQDCLHRDMFPSRVRSLFELDPAKVDEILGLLGRRRWWFRARPEQVKLGDGRERFVKHDQELLPFVCLLLRHFLPAGS